MMIRLVFILLLLLFGGCTTDFSDVFETEEKPVYIHFASDASINASVSESTRSKVALCDTLPIGILGLGLQEAELQDINLANQNQWTLRDWMCNDLYYYTNEDKSIKHSQGKIPSFPLEDSSAVAAYAYLPHVNIEHIIFNSQSCYIPLNIIADEAATDWMYTGKIAKTKTEAIEKQDSIFTFKFKHAMTRLDLQILKPLSLEEVKLLDINLGIHNPGIGLLSLEDGNIVLDSTTFQIDSVYYLRRRISDDTIDYVMPIRTESFYLIPQTKIHHLRVEALRNDQDTLVCEILMDSIKWNSDNLKAGTRSTIKVSSFKKKNL